jgi:hypothetical protein
VRIVRRFLGIRWVRSILLLLGLILAIFSIGPIFFFLHFVSQDLAPLSVVEDFVGVKVPQSATRVHHSYRSWQGVATYLRFDLPPNDVPSYVAALQAGKECSHTNPANNYTPFGAIGDRSDWFRPSMVRVFAGQRCVSGGIDYEFLIDKSDPNLSTIYLSAGAA